MTEETIAHVETRALIASDRVQGTKVFNDDGGKLGIVHNFMVDKRTGQVAYVVLSTGGFLGLGQAYHPIPWSLLSYDEERGGYVVKVTTSMLSGSVLQARHRSGFRRPIWKADRRLLSAAARDDVAMIADRDEDASSPDVNNELGDGLPKAEPDTRLRSFDDDTLLDMFDHAHETGDEQCDAIAAELHWRGIEVPPCRHEHAASRIPNSMTSNHR